MNTATPAGCRGMTLGQVDARLVDIAVQLRGLPPGPARWEQLDKANRLLDVRLALTRPLQPMVKVAA